MVKKQSKQRAQSAAPPAENIPDDCSVIPITDPIFRETRYDDQNNETRVLYFKNLLLKRSQYEHRLELGDVCAIASKEGRNLSPFPVPWLLGQILTLSCQQSVGEGQQFLVQIRYLMRMEDPLTKSFTSATSWKEVIRTCRPESNLLETLILAKVNVTDILPAWIFLRSFTLMNRENPDPPLPLGNGTFKLSYACPRLVRLDSCIEKVPHEWDSEKWGSEIVPPPLQRAWDVLIHNDPLRRAMAGSYQHVVYPTESACFVFPSVEEDTVNAKCVPPSKRKISVATRPATKADVALINTAVKRTAQTRAENGAAATTKMNRLQKARQGGETVLPEELKQRSRGTANKRPVKTAPAKSKLEQKEKRFGDFNQNSTAASLVMSSDSESSSSKIDRNIAPLSEIVYQMEKRKSMLYFYESIQLDEIRRKGARGKIQRWSLHVGDLVALAEQGFSAPEKPIDPKVRNIWYPFNRPWSGGQIVAIFKSDFDWQMQVRWLYRVGDLESRILDELSDEQREQLFESPLAGRMLIEVDEHVSQVKPEDAIGRIVITSNDNVDPKWLRSYHTPDGIVQAPMMCSLYLDTERDLSRLSRVLDWTNYGKSLDGPLGRGLVCEKCHPGACRDLLQKYEKFVRSKYNVTDPLPVRTRISANAFLHDRGRSTQWSVALLDKAAVQVESALCDSGNRKYYSSLRVTVVSARCRGRVIGRTKDASWSVDAGDVVCVACNDELSRQDSGRNNLFCGPWRVGQILVMFCEQSGKEMSAPMLEVRWFYRTADLPESCRPASFSHYDETALFETDLVVDRVPASRVLGAVALSHSSLAKPVRRGDRPDVPTVHFTCQFFYHSEFQRLQPIFFPNHDTKMVHTEMLARGCLLSFHSRVDERLRKHMSDLAIKLKHANGLHDNGLVNFKEGRLSKSEPFHTDVLRQNDVTRLYYLSASVLPKWDDYCVLDKILEESDRGNRVWRVFVGDLVAVRVEGEAVSLASTFPYRTKWKVCQIITIYRDDNNSKNQMYFFRVRSYGHDNNSSNKKFQRLQTTPIPSVVELDEADVEDLPDFALLGPLAILAPTSADCWLESVSTSPEPSFPFAPVIYAGCYRKNRSFLPPSSDVLKSLCDIVARGLSLMADDLECPRQKVVELYCDDLLEMRCHVTFCATLSERLLQSADERVDTISVDSPDWKNSSDKKATRAWTPSAPFYVQVSSGTTFFTEVEVRLPCSNYATQSFLNSAPNPCPSWSVKLGDVVILHYRGQFAGRVAFGSGAGGNLASQYYPFSVPWAVGEVVCIYKLAGKTTTNDVLLEIRWLYRINDLTGSVQSGDRHIDECDEIFESDNYDQNVLASSLLAPVTLHEKRTSISNENVENGIPQPEFFCARFWSVHRKSMVPIHSLQTRVQRGRLKSMFVAADSGLKAAFDDLDRARIDCQENQVIPFVSTGSLWKESFQNVINKLSLSDASKEAYENVSALIGREKEIREILSFLRDAIAGTGDNMNSTMFVAGPPGVGKTACIMASLATLKKEQMSRHVRDFNTVLLNCMEMRNPFESYVALWEGINYGKTRCSAEVSVRQLELYFSGEGKFERTDHVVVVLLDEIDYLVTKSQTVLYNFFNWPLLAARQDTGRRLIVVGISNTLNLPERLQPRVQSRIGNNRCYFKSYDELQTVAILNSKIKQAAPSYSVFNAEAIKLASKKTAAMSGDIRKAFHICRAAAEMILMDNSGKPAPVVMAMDVLKVSRDSFDSAQSRAITLCAPFEALLLVAIASLAQSTGRERGGFDMEEVVTKMESIANALGNRLYLPAPDIRETFGMLTRLAEADLLDLHMPQYPGISYKSTLAGCGGPWPLIIMVMDHISVRLALKDTAHKELAEKNIAMSRFT